ncbi:MAG TPA: PAS domain S-box protein [Candidatus Acidoferrum sp.]|nr:PAS domain S-box protein [Candidatus Acidoferrum sp.]
MEVGPFLRIAISIASALDKVHQRGLVHKDIKPANILVNGANGEVRLTGFGLASRLSRERQAPEPPETIVGTLAYMAPEQTGRMNRSIDSRSDLYALGVTFYQMLTGTLPFTAADPMEWVHCHVARRPVPPAGRRKEVRGAVSAIIMKLLAKTAEERYQTAAGLEHDLRRCLAEWEAQRSIDDFPLGEHDTPDRLLIPEKLYGREREIELLLAAFDRVVGGGTPELVLVSGYSGIGKSSVVNELHKVLVPSRGLFASGKFDQYKRDIPYSTLAQAFQSLIRGLLAKSEADLARWRDALREALGPNGQLMVDLVPELKLIIGDQALVPELPLQDAQGRFQLVVRRFVGVFARPEHPLALFLDDLQWLDAATLDLLEDLLTRSDLEHLLLIGAYRDNEVTSAHPLMRRLAALRQAGAPVQEFVLAPLGLDDVGRLLANALHVERDRAEPLARLVHEKTGGNPFFTTQLLSALAEEGLLAFDRNKARWAWDLEGLQAKGFTDNVVVLMLGKLSRLSEVTRAALRQLACLGNGAAITTLSLVHGGSEVALNAALSEAVSAGLVFRREGAYRFLHDRVQEAAYALIPAGERAVEHLRIGRLLAAHTPPEAIEENVFEIVSQLSRGVALITAAAEREKVAELSLRAGRRAKAATAYAMALAHFIAGEALLADDRWERHYALSFALALHRAECEFLTGEQGAAEARLAELARSAASLPDLAAVTRLQVELSTTLDRSERYFEVVLDYLRRVGIAWSAHPTPEEVRQEYERMWRQMGERPIEALLDLPRMADPVACGTMDVLTSLVVPWYTDENLRSLAIGRMVNLSLEHGNCDASCLAYIVVGTVSEQYFSDYEAGYRFGQLGLDLVEKCGLDRYKARVYLGFGSVLHPLKRHVRTGRLLVRHAIDAAQQSGDFNFATFGRHHLVTHLLASGDPLGEVQREAEAGLDFARQARGSLTVDRITAQLQLIWTLRGLTPEFGRLDDAGFNEERFERHLESGPHFTLAACWYWIRKLQARVLVGDHAAAIAAAAQADRLLWTSSALFERADYHFYAALARAALGDAATAAERTRHMEALAAHHRHLQVWAENCPENFENRAALVGAEIARLEARELEAERLYEQAIRSARDNGFVQNAAIAYERASTFYRARGFDDFAVTYLRKARDCYARWGADGKVRQLDQLYPHLHQEEPAPAPTSTIGAPVEHLDLATVIKVSQAVSSEIVLEKLIGTLMRSAIEQAGAEHGLLILSQGAEPRIAAQATTGDTIAVELRDEPVTAAALPESVLHYVVRTNESVILDDAAAQSPYSADPYIRQHNVRSILCLPLLNQGKLTGVLYLENNLAPRAFAPARIAVLKLLASQAAIALENTRLYRDLEEREAKIRRLVDANIIGIFTWELESQILEANDAFLRIVGHDREDIVSGRVHWADLTPPEWRDRGAQTIEELKRTGIAQPFEREYFRKDGSRVPVLIGAASFAEGGNQGVAFVLDLTERKRAEEALRDSEEQWKAVFENNPTMFFMVDATGAIMSVNPFGAEQLGYTADELIGRPVQDLFHEADRQAALRNTAICLEQLGRAMSWELRKVSRDGEVLWVRETARAMLLKKRPVVLIVCEDITERKRAEYLTGQVFEYSPDAICVVGRDYRYQRVNPVFQRTWGMPAERVVGKHVADLVGTEIFEQNIKPNYDRCFAGEEVSYTDWFTDSRGRVYVAVTYSPLRPNSVRVEAALVIAHDLTDHMLASEALRAAQAELAHVNRVATMGQLTASIAHEVNQPIAAAVTNAAAALRWLGGHPPDLEEVRQALGRIVDNGTRAGDVIGRIRSLIKKAPPRKSRFDLNEAIRDVIVLTRSEMLRHGVSLQTQLAEDSLFIEADRIQLQQVILNLIMNAIEAMSSIDEGERELLISVGRDASGGALVAVRDSGPGLDPASVDRLFEAFYTTKPDGMGMGLAICRSIIETHGGRLSASANEPRGAVLQFTLPPGGDETGPAEHPGPLPVV